MAGRIRGDRIALHDFVRLLAETRAVTGHEPVSAADNKELVRNLKRDGVLTKDLAYKAMLSCPRGMFIPPPHEDQAYRDDPIRVEASGFNISAPHMHATALETLDFQPGERVLDVGCGCGIVAACAAYMVGRNGVVVGVDIREDCIKLCHENVRKVKEFSSEFVATAADVVFELHNVFMPSPRHRGQYHKVHVGATCPEDRLSALLSLLQPTGGQLMVPVGSDLRVITKRADGSISQTTISQVRFSDLEVPSDAEVVLKVLDNSIAQRQVVSVPASTLAEDLAEASPDMPRGHLLSCFCCKKALPGPPSAAAAPAGPDGSISMDLDTGSGTGARDQSPGGPQRGGGADGGGESNNNGAALTAPDGSRGDCWLAGPGWRLGAHRDILRARCELYRARSSSGMRDAYERELRVPDNFSAAATAAFLHYVYSDELPADVEPALLVDLISVAPYFGTPRLSVLCESALADHLLRESNADAAAELSAELLALSHEHALRQLHDVALTYVVQHHECVRECEAYRALPAALVDDVAAEAVRQNAAMRALLEELAPRVRLPPPHWR